MLQKKTPAVFNEKEIGEKYPTDYNESMNTVLTQEVIRYNGLIKIMQVTLNDV